MLLLLLSLLFHSAVGSYNFLIVITDDQDLLLKSLEPLKKIDNLLTNKGVIFSNAYASSPICCPSRSSFLTGTYAHNTHTKNNSREGGCYSRKWIENFEPKTFPAIMNENGYKTFYAGKYLNTYYSERVPYGYDEFFGLHGNSKYYNYTLNQNGKTVEYGDRTDDYLVTVLKNHALQFLQNVSKEENFLAIISPPACHAPFTPEEKYKDTLKHLIAPRTRNFNVGPKTSEKHWLVTMKPRHLSDEVIKRVDDIYHSRLETLLSVDDMIEDLVQKLSERDLIDNTFIIFTSDHGYHLGNFALPYDKRQPYETDIKVPLIVRGPAVKEKAVINQPVILLDIFPTLLDLANIPNKNVTAFDGQSFRHLLNASTQPHESNNERQILIEYHGEGNVETYNPQCPWKKNQKLNGCDIETDCKCQDSWNNTYACVRHFSFDTNFIFCSFDDDENFQEAYDLSTDQQQMSNIAYDILPSIQAKYLLMIEDLKSCVGDGCRVIKPI